MLRPALSCLLLACASTAAAAPPVFERDVLPVLKQRCVRCHGPEIQESRVRLDNLSTDLINDRAAAEFWHEVLNVLNAGEMPPDDEPQLTDAERKVVTQWVRGALDAAIEARRKTDGRVVLRRLNRVEYQNTMFDLLGLEMDYAEDLPPDPQSSDGFRNNGQSLRISALQLETYLTVARRALDRVIVEGEAPKVFHHTFEKSNVKNWLGQVERSNRLVRYQNFLGKMTKDYPESGEFLIRVKLKAELRGEAGYPLLEVGVGYRPDTKILFREVDVVELTDEDERELEFRGRLENHPLPVRGQGKFPGLVVRLRNIYDNGAPKPKFDKKSKSFADEPDLSAIHVESVEFQAPYFEQWPPASHRRILFDSPLREEDENAYAKEVLKRFMRRAYRRPATEAEVRVMVDFFAQIRAEFPTFESAIRETLAMVLIRPEFLYLLEPGGDEKRPLDNWELASRLSYFLWSTMPDETLFQLAQSGELRKREVLEEQVERMLGDERAERFIEQFADQWMKLNTLDGVAVSKDIHPDFKETLKSDIRREPIEFFGHLVRNDLSAMLLLDSQFVVVNEPLAKHYGLENVRGAAFRPVDVAPEHHRGGVLGQAAILLANSTGADSHPVRRAVWIRDRLLNDPPAPPPPDTPSLEEADPKFHKLSIREQMVVHRGDNACASCHRGIDALGIALENYDALGQWRTEVRRKVGRRKFENSPVVAVDKLNDEITLDGRDGLIQHLQTARRDDFANALTRRLLVYALGRRLELGDEQAVDELAAEFAEQDYRLKGLIRSIVVSKPFITK